jgi:hypothetical protein
MPKRLRTAALWYGRKDKEDGIQNIVTGKGIQFNEVKDQKMWRVLYTRVVKK